jgi:hypothetical protein
MPMATKRGMTAPGRWQGAVIVDVVFEDGLLFLAVRNIGDAPARKVSVRFDRELPGAGGRIDVAALALFRNIEFLAPRKSIRTFLDTSASWFARAAPTRFAARVTYVDAAGRRRSATVVHDLEIYRGIGYVRRGANEGGNDGSAT